MKNITFRCLTFIFVLSLLSCYQDKIIENKNISGAVTLSGVGIEGVRLKLSSTENGEMEVESDSDGNFVFPDLWEGEYSVETIDKWCNFNVTKYDIELNSSNKNNINFEIILSYLKLFGDDSNSNQIELKFFDIYQTSDYGYLICGMIKDDSSPESGYDSVVFKLNQYGNIEISKVLGGVFNEKAVSCYELENGNYFVSGTTSSSLENDNTNCAIVYELKRDDLSIVKSTVIGSNKTEDLISSKYYEVGGNSFALLTGTTNQTTSDSGWLLKVDLFTQENDVLWSNVASYPGFVIDSTAGIYENIDSCLYFLENEFIGYLFLGRETKEGNNSTIINKIGKNDPQNSMENIVPALVSNSEQAVNILQLPDESVIYTINYQNTDPGNYYPNARFIKYNSQLTEKIDEFIPFTNICYEIVNTVITMDNQLVSCYKITEAAITTIYIEKRTFDFKLVWSKQFAIAGSQDNTVQKIIQTKDLGFVVIGYSEFGGKSKGWVLKLNRCGEVILDNIDENFYR